MTVLDSYSVSNYSSDGSFAAYPSDNGAFYQSFTTPNDGVSYKLTSITLYMPKGTGATGTFQVEVYAHTGVYGTSSATTGSALATSEVNDQDDISSDSNAACVFTFTGANQITLTPNTHYVFVVKCLTLSGTIALSLDSTTPTHAGNAGSWTSA
jgi:hypothetical protein